MSYFSIPADFKIETVDKYIDINERYDDQIIETYGQINSKDNLFGSGRPWDLIPLVGWGELEKYICYSQKNNIKFNYVLNSLCLGNKEFTDEGVDEILCFIKQLYSIGITSLTVAMPSLIELIKYTGLPFEIKASTICNITNSDRAKSYKTMGVDRIVLDESINRDFNELRAIRKVYGEKVELIANVICYKNCIYRFYHHNQMSHDWEYGKKNSIDYYSNRCALKRMDKPENILKMNFIRPEDITYYEDIGIQYFKLQGRQAVMKGNLPKAVESYFKRSYDGDLLLLLDSFTPTNNFRQPIHNKSLDGFIEPFYRNNICSNNCSQCNYCSEFFSHNFLVKDTIETNNLAKTYYSSTDSYINKIKKIMGDKINGE
ncbi:protease [Anaerocolumna cellulosilytica]|uniref:Protease n=1 Tax=Anaerocolumna cellulosilytica TaxID=433286 RepID=A0A6S6R545_9FIRM|nr:U32 family peptidase [Anaerocolumna cellulosilytica]MBB5194859.1 collagenase-like PrtC family protease [Anaerocolumna cellulosilytica]BCJ94178.1 protease [Anaerocolumna cellulosilytica]